MKRLICLLFLLPSLALADSKELPWGKAATISFYLVDDSDPNNLLTTGAHASGDTTISCDQGNFANTTNGFTDEGIAYSITLTAAEMSCDDVMLCVVDQGTKLWSDRCIEISTRLTSPTGTAQAGAAGTITLAAGASASNDTYNEYAIYLAAGTGSEQVRCITDYVGSTKVATIGPRNWDTTPDNTSKYVLIADPGCQASATSVWAAAKGSELSACPTASSSYGDQLVYMFQTARNKLTQTSTTATQFKDDGSTSLCTSTVSDNGTTFTRGEFN